MHSHVYRDWVIRAFNEDLPYDKFLIQQIAADCLDRGDDRRPLAAMGFLTLGETFLQNFHDIIDERIDVVTRGTMALTVTCARCHDHKFDPIPAEDYYSLYGVFYGSTEKTLPLIDSLERTEALREYEEELERRTEALRTTYREKREDVLERMRSRVGDYLLAALNVRS